MKRASRAKQDRPERRQDPRLIASRVLAEGDIPVTEETWIVAISPVEMDDGQLFAWSTPQAVVFNLIEAEKFRKHGVRERRKIMSRLVREGGTRRPKNNTATLDCVSDLQVAALSTFTAIEALTNHGANMLDPETVVKSKNREVPQPEVVRRLGTEDKFKYALPML